MTTSSQQFTIGRLAQHAGVGIDTVRFYERAGLMAPARRTAGGYRLYGAEDVDRLRFIRRAKALGFTLEQVAELLSINAGGEGRARVKALAEQRLLDLDGKLRELTAMRDALALYVRRCSGQGPVEGCPIIEAVVHTSIPEDAPCTTHPKPKPRPAPATAARARTPRR